MPTLLYSGECTANPRGRRRSYALAAITRTLAADPLGGTVRRTVLPNGLRILTESIPAMRSVSFGIWVGIGSRDETPARAGVSHFLEHLLFKGTKRRTALDISASIEAVGGETNAFTTKEYTCYYARVLDADAPLAVDVMCDLVVDSVLAPADVETERGVILEEIATHDDEPGDEVHDLFAEAIYGGDTPLGRLISGTVETITPMTRKQIQSFYRSRYTPANMVVSAAGNLDHVKLVKMVRARSSAPEPVPTAGRPSPDGPGRRYASRPYMVRDKDTEQAHIVYGCEGYSRLDRDGSRSAYSTTASAAACPAGCSRRSGRSAAWRTRSTRTPRSTPTPACSPCTPAARRARRTRCST